MTISGGRVLSMVSVVGLVAALSAGPSPAVTAHTASPAAGQSIALPGYKIQSSARVSDSAAAISTPGYAANGWYPVGPRSTVLAGLLENGAYPDPFFSTNMRNIPAADFTVPWWYRSDFTLGSEAGLSTFLDFSGVLSSADVWVNGTQVATAAQVAGAYPHHELNITPMVRAGTNSVAFKINPNDPNRHLTIGWIDWVQSPPDRNMGIFRDVLVRRNSAVALRNAHVLTRLTVPALDRAELTVKVDARNESAAAVRATVAGTIGSVSFSTEVDLAAHQTKTVTFAPSAYPQLSVANPRVWWPYGMGGQPLYDLDLAATVGGAETDSAHQRFGIRDVQSSLNGNGSRSYRINGRPLLIKGGGWQQDLFMRHDQTSLEDRLRYVRDLGLNTIRLEGHLEPDEFFDLTDAYGILALPGWECCNKWQSMGSWTSADHAIAKASAAAEGARLRNHPSVFSFLISSDVAPTATVEREYVDALNSVDWPNPIVSSAADVSAPITGRSGMKMTGPYDWVPPNYWYNKRFGGAFGFNSETSAGPDVPTLDTLRRMMTTGELNTLWQNPSATQYHRSPSSTFNNLRIFNNAMAGRYGAPTSLADYVRKAQLAQYEAVRAQFEAYGRNASDASNPSTGVIYWMLNSGWTSLHWQLFDRYLDQGGAYYGAKEANEPLHVQYSYDNRSVVVVNSNHGTASNLSVRTDVYNLDGTAKYTNTSSVTVPGGGGKATAVTIPSITGLSTTYLVRLTLSDGSGEIDRNVYWLSTRNDVIDYANNQWYYAPTTSFADLKGLAGMASAPVRVTASTSASGDTTTTTVTLRHTGGGQVPAFYLDTHIVDPAGTPVLPTRWSDNAISLWPGESKTLTVSYRTADLHGTAPWVRLSGWNVATQSVPADGSTPPPVVNYQAEDAVVSQGVVESNHAGFTGTGFVNYDNVVGSSVQFTVNAPTAGPAVLSFRFANGTTANRPMDIAVNGTTVVSGLSFAGTGAWTTWQTRTATVTLNAGANTIRATATTANGGPNLDALQLG